MGFGYGAGAYQQVRSHGGVESADPHGLAMHDGKLISCDAGIHPGWPNFDSPFSGSIFEINLV